jgi:hypothetical protein
MLLGEEHQPVGPTALMTVVIPVVAWTALALMLITCVRYVTRLRRNGLPTTRRPGAAGWIRSVLPGAVYLAAGLALVAAPLGMARHFHPDVGWALTIGSGLAIVLGVVLLALTVRDGFRRPTRSS